MATLRLLGREFTCRDSIAPGRMMKLAKGMQATHPMDMYAAMYDFATALVVEEERSKLDKALDDLEDMSDFNTAIGEAMKEIAGRPTEAASSSQGGQPTTERTSRVVSLSQGTAQTATEPSRPGRSEAG